MVISKTLIAPQIFKKFPAFYGTHTHTHTHVHPHVHISPPLAPTLSKVNSYHTFPFCFSKKHFNIILPCTQAVSYRQVSHQNSVHISLLYVPHTPHFWPSFIWVKNDEALHSAAYFSWCYFHPLRFKYFPKSPALELSCVCSAVSARDEVTRCNFVYLHLYAWRPAFRTQL